MVVEIHFCSDIVLGHLMNVHIGVKPPGSELCVCARVRVCVHACVCVCACVCVLCGIKSQYCVMVILLLEDSYEAK